jgi:hypothetical protein
MDHKQIRELLDLKGFLLNEEQIYLGQRVGDILAAIQELQEDAPNMGKRHLMRVIKNIVGQIRRILHGSWSFEDEAYLKELQKIGVVLMRGLDNNEELPSLVASATAAMQELSNKIDQPVNKLGAAATKEKSQEDEE